MTVLTLQSHVPFHLLNSYLLPCEMRLVWFLPHDIPINGPGMFTTVAYIAHPNKVDATVSARLTGPVRALLHKLDPALNIFVISN